MGYYMEYTVMNGYKSCPYTVPVNRKALHHTRIKELQVRMMRWISWVKDERIPNKEMDKDKWQHRFTFTLKCGKRAGKLNKQELEMLNRLWGIYE